MAKIRLNRTKTFRRHKLAAQAEARREADRLSRRSIREAVRDFLRFVDA